MYRYICITTLMVYKNNNAIYIKYYIYKYLTKNFFKFILNTL